MPQNQAVTNQWTQKTTVGYYTVYNSAQQSHTLTLDSPSPPLFNPAAFIKELQTESSPIATKAYMGGGLCSARKRETVGKITAGVQMCTGVNTFILPIFTPFIHKQLCAQVYLHSTLPTHAMAGP